MPLEVASTEYPHIYDLSDEPLVSQGQRANNHKLFLLPFHGIEIYYLLAILDRLAEAGGPLAQIRPAVLAAEMIRERARERGF